MPEPYWLPEVKRFLDFSVRMADGRAMRHFFRLGDRAAVAFVVLLRTTRPADKLTCLKVCDGLLLAFGRIDRIDWEEDRSPTLSVFLLEEILQSTSDHDVRSEAGSALVRLRDIAARPLP